jgi:hypothetical protein
MSLLAGTSCKVRGLSAFPATHPSIASPDTPMMSLGERLSHHILRICEPLHAKSDVISERFSATGKTISSVDSIIILRSINILYRASLANVVSSFSSIIVGRSCSSDIRSFLYSNLNGNSDIDEESRSAILNTLLRCEYESMKDEVAAISVARTEESVKVLEYLIGRLEINREAFQADDFSELDDNKRYSPQEVNSLIDLLRGPSLSIEGLCEIMTRYDLEKMCGPCIKKNKGYIELKKCCQLYRRRQDINDSIIVICRDAAIKGESKIVLQCISFWETMAASPVGIYDMRNDLCRGWSLVLCFAMKCAHKNILEALFIRYKTYNEEMRKGIKCVLDQDYVGGVEASFACGKGVSRSMKCLEYIVGRGDIMMLNTLLSHRLFSSVDSFLYTLNAAVKLRRFDIFNGIAVAYLDRIPALNPTTLGGVLTSIAQNASDHEFSSSAHIIASAVPHACAIAVEGRLEKAYMRLKPLVVTYEGISVLLQMFACSGYISGIRGIMSDYHFKAEECSQAILSAVDAGHRDVVRFFLGRKELLSPGTVEEAFVRVVQRGDVEQVRSFFVADFLGEIDAGCPIVHVEEELNLITDETTISKAFEEAIKSGSVAMVTELYVRHPRSITQRHMEIAALHGHRDVIDFFLGKDNTEEMYLHAVYSAAHSDHMELVSYLFEKAETMATAFLMPLFSLALQRNHPVVIKRLLSFIRSREEANATFTTKVSSPYLFIYGTKPRLKAVALASEDVLTSFKMAFEAKNIAVVRLLIEKFSEDNNLLAHALATAFSSPEELHAICGAFGERDKAFMGQALRWAIHDNLGVAVNGLLSRLGAAAKKEDLEDFYLIALERNAGEAIAVFRREVNIRGGAEESKIYESMLLRAFREKKYHSFLRLCSYDFTKGEDAIVSGLSVNNTHDAEEREAMRYMYRKVLEANEIMKSTLISIPEATGKGFAAGYKGAHTRFLMWFSCLGCYVKGDENLKIADEWLGYIKKIYNSMEDEERECLNTHVLYAMIPFGQSRYEDILTSIYDHIMAKVDVLGAQKGGFEIKVLSVIQDVRRKWEKSRGEPPRKKKCKRT